MNILLLTAPLLPQPGNNANLISKLLPYLCSEHTVHLLAPAYGVPECPETVFGVPVHWVKDDRRDFARRVLFPAASRLVDPHGYSDWLQSALMLREIARIREVFPFDAVIATAEPYMAALTAARLHDVRKVLYLMDPPECTYGSDGTPLRRRKLGSILAAQDLILTTPFIRRALADCGYGSCDSRMETVGFPMVEPHQSSREPRGKGDRIDLLFCGWLYSNIRSPQYFLDVLSRLDARFRVTFMGKECDKLRDRFSFETRAEVITLPQQPYQAAIDAMADADVLINIGNSIPVHMPSKTLEYINTGKPMVNFNKFPDCPTRYYTDRYPLCLNLSEDDPDLDAAAAKFERFCLQSVGKTVSRSFLEQEYADCTPQYIAQKILEKLGDHHD